MGGDFCCAVGCHNHRAAPANQNVSFHAFPRDVQRRAKWIAAVRREHWVPVKRSRLCSIHFSPESYELSSRLATEFGLGQKYPRLRVNAVPTIFSHIVARPTPHRGALAKRRRKDVVDEAIAEATTEATAVDTTMDSGSQSPLDPDADMEVPDDLPAEEQGTEKVCVSVQTECVKTRTRSNQTKVTGRSIGTQTALSKSSKEVQTEAPQQSSPSTSTTVLVEAETDDDNLEADDLGGRSLRLAVDGRSDSPGYSALYGTYSLLETSLNRIIHLELIKSTEVKSSCHMELEGLTRAFLHLEELGLTVEVIVTDRHVQVSAYMKRQHLLVQHRFDLWHVSKGIKKKIVALAKSPQHKALARWLETITRHLYWCARTSDNHGDLILAKWTSITRHICDVHHHSNSLHPVCLHGELQDRLWIEEGTETFKKLESVVLSSHLLRDIHKLSSDEQTFSLEAFHGVLVHFASKSVSYC
ncbi:hypothetical protein HPB47_013245 [Ixodes persulcatus]|uniref:Uncharacterized protein n=1 Tax=Ixodes persulcatus TaxID=34615 RepID=A0AC60QZ79_IXOPE|nr:hypothetical protein HPB47_013245 [Ixodes persulcatus]